MRLPVMGACALFLLLGTVGVRDAGALNLGPLTATPYVSESAVYDDNVFVQNTGSEVADWYFLTSPGMLLKLRQRDNLFEAEYRADIYRYIKTGDLNDVTDQFVRGAFNFNFPGGLSIKLDDLFSMAHEPKSSINAGVIGVTPKSRFDSNELGAEVAYALSDRFKTALAYRYYTISYDLDANTFRDRDENSADLTVFYRFLPKTSVLLEGIYKNVQHNNTSGPFGSIAPLLNSDEYWGMAGLTWDITAKSTGSVKAGYESKQFRSGSQRSFDSPVYQVSIVHNFTPKTAFTLTGTRQADETDDPTVSYYTTTNGMLEIRYRPVRKIEIRPHGSYTYERYSGPTSIAGLPPIRRIDHVFDAGIELTYNIQKWLGVSLGYTHTKRASDLTFYDYTDNTALAQLKFSL